MQINIFQNGRFVYFDSNTELKNIKPHSHIRFDGKTFKIQLYKKINKTFEYKGIDNNIITLKRDAEPYLIKGDLISVNTPTYSLSTVIKIVKSEEGFHVGDIISEKSDRPFTLIVNSIDKKGKIKSLGIQDEGHYLTQPDSKDLKYETIDGKNIDVEFDLLFEESSYTTHEVIVEKINRSATELILNLNAKIIPFNFKSKISISKYCIVLSEEYLGETKYGIECEISSDFTPHLAIPYAVQNSASIADLYNEAIEKIDKELQELRVMILKS